MVAQKRAELRRYSAANCIELWPEHWRAVALFFGMGTQWNVSVGMAGLLYHGLKYEVLPLVEQRIPPDPQDPIQPTEAEVFEQLQILEREALKHLNQTRD